MECRASVQMALCKEIAKRFLKSTDKSIALLKIVQLRGRKLLVVREDRRGVKKEGCFSATFM